MRGFGLTIEPLAGGAVCVALRGELDLEHAYTFDEEMKRLEKTRPHCLVLDLRGVKVHPMQFAPIGHDPEVVEFQVVEEPDGLLVLVVARGVAPAVEERIKAKVEQGLSELGVPEPTVTVERRDALARQPGGKLQIVVARRGSYAPGDASGGRELQGTHASRA